MKVTHLAGVLAALTFVPSLIAQIADPAKPVTIKGHAIGESLAAFIATRPAIREEIAACRDGSSLDKAEGFTRQIVADNCQTLISALDSGTRYAVNENDSDGTTTFEFNHNKLVGFELLRSRTAFADALNNMKGRFGKPTEQVVSKTQNALGATFERPIAFWTLRTVEASLSDAGSFEDAGYVQRCLITIRTSDDAAARLADEQASKKDVLQ